MREIYKIGATASEFGNSAKIVVPRSWLGKEIIAMLKSEWDEIYEKVKRKEIKYGN